MYTFQKERHQTYIIIDNTIVYLENTNFFIDKLLELIFKNLIKWVGINT